MQCITLNLAVYLNRKSKSFPSEKISTSRAFLPRSQSAFLTVVKPPGVTKSAQSATESPCFSEKMFVGIIEHSVRWLQDCHSLPKKKTILYIRFIEQMSSIKKFVYDVSIIEFVSTFYV